MIGSALFRRHYFVSLAIIAIGLGLSFGASTILTSMVREKTFRPPSFMVRKMIALSGKPACEAVGILNQDPDSPFRFEILSADAPEVQRLSATEREHLRAQGSVRVSGERSGPPGDIVALENGEGYLTMRPVPGRGPGPGPGAFLPIVLGCMILGVIVATAIAIISLFSSYRERARIADGVLQQLKSGNLSARLPMQKMDELSGLVISFNHMADEIENLVHRIRQSEAGRMQILQRLAHDLRTPIASMKMFLETLSDDRGRMTDGQIQRSLDLCLAEGAYFERLVEDLLTLSSVAEPNSPDSTEEVDLADSLSRLGAFLHERSPAIAVTVKADGPCRLRAHRWLIERLLRNGLENAVSFARSRVDIELQSRDGAVVLRIRDDGAGVNQEVIDQFGKLRKTRKLETQQGLRVSLGIGSVIMKEVAARHGGDVSLGHRSDHQSGAELTIRLNRV